MATIHILDRHTAELIAAGEVVERPSAVVKELTENAIDAGATIVTVSIESGGTSLIEVADNGCGIEPDELPTAFVRHATSKIAGEQDLEAIGTLGFRGEALPSIAAVAKVTVTSKTDSGEYAVRYRIFGGEEMDAEPAARGRGTTVEVRDLFYNTPARMKFLRKDKSEGNFCQDIVSQLALSHPEISFRFTKDGADAFATPGDGDLLSAIYALYGRDFSGNLLAVSKSASIPCVTGYISKPATSRGSRSMQHFYINGRFVKSRTLQAALEAAYKGYIMVGRFPSCVLNVSLPLEKVDVNVHPAKTEVRFSDERDVFHSVYTVVRNTLAGPAAGENHLRFADTAPDDEEKAFTAAKTSPPAPEPAPGPDELRTYHAPFITAVWPTGAGGTMFVNSGSGDVMRSDSYTPYARRPDIEVSDGETLPGRDTAGAQAPSAGAAQSAQESFLEEMRQETQDVEHLRLVGEVFGTYVIAQRSDTLCLIDKHAAHERILYERLLASKGNPAFQILMMPVTVSLSGQEKNDLMDNIDLLTDAGFEVDDFGGGSLVVRAVPQDLPVEDIAPALQEIAQKLYAGARDTTTSKQDWVYASVACRAAIKAGDRSSPEELLSLADKILSGKTPLFCPHGRPILLKMTRKELEKNFGRIVQ